MSRRKSPATRKIARLLSRDLRKNSTKIRKNILGDCKKKKSAGKEIL